MTPITPEQRRKVAEACCPPGENCHWGIDSEIFVVIFHGYSVLPGTQWLPSDKDGHYRALVQKIAQLIEALPRIVNVRWNEEGFYEVEDSRKDYLERFNTAVATNNITDLEKLLLELVPNSEEI